MNFRFHSFGSFPTLGLHSLLRLPEKRRKKEGKERQSSPPEKSGLKTALQYVARRLASRCSGGNSRLFHPLDGEGGIFFFNPSPAPFPEAAFKFLENCACHGEVGSITVAHIPRHKGTPLPKTKIPNARPDKSNGDPLSSFLASVDRFTETISAQILAVVGEGEDRLVIESTGESMVAQTRKLTNHIREVAPGITPIQRRDLDQFLRIQDGEALVDRALRVSEQTLSGGGGAVTMGFLSWIDEIMFTLKKIIHMIFDLFGGMPKWLDTILLIIDELLKLLKSLLGGQVGLKMSEVAEQGSQDEVHFLQEITALAELQATRRSRRNSDEESSC
jgi:hypothetical protein